MVADFLPCRLVVKFVFLLDNLNLFYRAYVFFSIPFESLLEESRTQEKIDNIFVNVLDVGILYYKSRICALGVCYWKNILHDCQ